MEKFILFAISIIIFIIFLNHYTKTYKKAHEKIDGVETIDGIQYLVRNTDVKYVMGRLAAIRNSEVIKEKNI